MIPAPAEVAAASPGGVGHSQKLDGVRFPAVEGDQLLGVELPKLVGSHPVRLLQRELGPVNGHRRKVILGLEDFVVGDVGKLEVIRSVNYFCGVKIKLFLIET